VPLTGCIFELSNYGDPLAFPDDQLFKRFIKSSGKEGGTGIGLEIVRKICNYYRIDVGHNFKQGVHTFRVDFSNIEIAIKGSKLKIED